MQTLEKNPKMKKTTAIQELITQLIAEIAVLAKDLDTLMGRQVGFPMGDGQAIYVVTKVKGIKSVEVTWVMFCDAWQDSRLGYQGELPYDYVLKHVQGQDRMAELFGKK